MPLHRIRMLSMIEPEFPEMPTNHPHSRGKNIPTPEQNTAQAAINGTSALEHSFIARLFARMFRAEPTEIQIKLSKKA